MKHRILQLFCVIFTVLLLAASCQTPLNPTPSAIPKLNADDYPRRGFNLGEDGGGGLSVEGVDIAYTMDDNGDVVLKLTESEADEIIAGAEGDFIGIDVSTVPGAKGIFLEADPAWFAGSDKGLRMALPTGEILSAEAPFWGDLQTSAGSELRIAFREGPDVIILKGDDPADYQNHTYPFHISAPHTLGTDETEDFTLFEKSEGAAKRPLPRSRFKDGKLHGVIYGAETLRGANREVTVFQDVKDDWMEDAVMYLASRGVVNGTSAATYRPEQPVTRAEFVTILMRMLDVKTPIAETPEPSPEPTDEVSPSPTDEVSPSPTDEVSPSPTEEPEPEARRFARPADNLFPATVKTATFTSEDENAFNDADKIPDWAEKSVSLAKALGIVLGDTAGNFNPNLRISRQDMFLMTYRTIQKFRIATAATSNVTPDYTDWGSTAPYAADALKALDGLGLIKGSGGKLNPTGPSTRAEAAQFVFNVLEYDAAIRITPQESILFLR